jgi:hypothetical protein
MLANRITALGALLLAAASGCSGGNPKTHPVRGTVRFPDGKPLTHGTVEFELTDAEKPITATGQIREDGTFVLGTFAPDDGAIAGRHRAVVIADQQIGTGVERPGVLPPSALHPRFRDFKTSGLEFTVEPGENEITIPVEYAPRAGR